MTAYNKIYLLRTAAPPESLTPDKREACLILRNEGTWGAFFNASI